MQAEKWERYPSSAPFIAITKRVMIMNKLIVVLGLAVALVGCDAAVDAQMDYATDKVTDDVIAQYEIVKKQGDPIQTCVHAGVVSAAYLQAKDEAKYAEWKAIEKEDCKAAGMPQ